MEGAPGRMAVGPCFSSLCRPSLGEVGKLEIAPSSRTRVPGTSACLSFLTPMAVLILRNEEYEGMQR